MLAGFREDVPPEVEAVLVKMLAKDPAERFQTPVEVAAALAAIRSLEAAHLPQVQAASSRGHWRMKVLTALATVLLAVLAATIFYIQTDNGVVRVEVVDPTLQVTLNGKTIEMKDGEVPLTIRTGGQKLIVRRGDFEFETSEFELRRHDEIVLKVELLPGQIVVLKDGQRFSAKSLPPGNSISVTIEEDGRYFIDGRPVDDAVELMNRLKGLLEEDPQREVSIDSAEKNGIAPVKQLAALVRQLGGQQVRWPTWVGPELDGELRSVGPQTNPLRLVRQYSGHEAAIDEVSISPNGQFAVSVDENGRVIVWDLATAKELRQFKGHSAPVYSVDIAGDNRTVATGDRQANVLLWNAETGQLIRRLAGHKGSVSSLSFAEDGKRLASGGPIEGVRIWDCSSGQLVRILEPQGHVQEVAYSPDGRLIAAGGKERQLHVWNAETGELLHEIATADNLIALAWSPDMSQIACSLGWTVETSIHVVNLKERRVERELPLGAGCWGLTYAADGRHLVSVSTDGRLIVWSVESGRQLSSVSDTTTGHLSLSPDGKAVLTGGGTKLHLWELPAASVDDASSEITLAGQLAGHTNVVRACASCPATSALPRSTVAEM